MTRGSLPRTRLHLGTPDANDALVLALQSRAAVLLAATGVPLHLVFVPEYPHEKTCSGLLLGRRRLTRTRGGCPPGAKQDARALAPGALTPSA